MRRLLATTALLGALAGCADYRMVEQQAPQEAVQHQQQVMSRWTRGMDAAQVGYAINWRRDSDYQSLEQDGRWRLEQVYNEGTSASFGLLLHDDKLVSLVSSTDIQHVTDCLLPYNLEGKHWLVRGVGTYSQWLESRAEFGDVQALSAHGTVTVYAHDTPTDQARRARGAPSVDDVITVVGYSPLFVLAAPALIPYYLLHGGKTQEAERTQIMSWLQFQSALRLGEPVPDAQQFPPDSTFDVDGTRVEQYASGFAYGVRDGQVVMLESPAVMELRDRLEQHAPDHGKGFSLQHSRDDCAALRSH